MIKICERCAKLLGAATLWELTCIGAWGACDRCGVVHRIRSSKEERYEGIFRSHMVYKASREDLHVAEQVIERNAF